MYFTEVTGQTLFVHDGQRLRVCLYMMNGAFGCALCDTEGKNETLWTRGACIEMQIKSAWTCGWACVHVLCHYLRALAQIEQECVAHMSLLTFDGARRKVRARQRASMSV